jgi:lysophospholipase L1-like esterase
LECRIMAILEPIATRQLTRKFGRAIYDLTQGGGGPDYFPAYRAALNASKAGVSRTVIVALGDSTFAGQFGGTPTNSNYGNDARSGSSPHQLQDLFVSDLGLPVAGKNIFGSGGGGASGGGSPPVGNAGLLDYDHELQASSAWAPSTTATVTSLGGTIVASPAAASTPYGFPDATFDTLEIYHPLNVGLSSQTSVSIGGSTVANFTEVAASPAVAKKKYSGAVGGTGTLVANRAGGGSYIIGLVGYAAANKGVAVLNLGWGGSSTIDWTDTSVAFNAAGCLPLVLAGSSLVLCNLAINDWQTATPLATYKANLTSLMNQAKAAGADFMFVGPNRTDTALTPQATQDAYVAAMQEVAIANNCKFFDTASIPQLANYATAQANGLMGDQRHPNKAGYTLIAAAIYAILKNP